MKGKRLLRASPLAIILLIALLCLPILTSASHPPSLEGLSLQQLESVLREADTRIRQLLLPGSDGYVVPDSWEAYRREPEQHVGEKLRLEGELFWVGKAEKPALGKSTESGASFLYQMSLPDDPGQVFLISYVPKPGEALLLPGDSITAFGVFESLKPAPGADDAEIGLPSLTAELCALSLPKQKPLAAPPYAATRRDPAPLNTQATYAGSYWSDYAAFEIEMLSSLQGDAAQKKAKAMSSYNVTPRRGQEYFIIELRVKALSAPSGKAEIGNEDFFFVSAGGAEYQPHFLINNAQPLRTLYEGSEQTALIACLVDRGDRPLVVYLPSSPEPLWFNPNP